MLTIRKFGYAKRSCKLLPLSEKSLCLSKERKKQNKTVCSVAKICGKNQSPICEIVKKEKVICASLTVAPQTKEVVVTVFDKCSGKMGKAFHLYNKIF